MPEPETRKPENSSANSPTRTSPKTTRRKQNRTHGTYRTDRTNPVPCHGTGGVNRFQPGSTGLIGSIGPMSPIRPIRPIPQPRIVTALAAGMVKPFCEPAFSEEMLLQRAELLVKQVVGLVDETDHGVSRNLRQPLLNIGPIGLIGPIRPVGQRPDRTSLRMVLAPNGQVPLPEKILIVLEQFLQAPPHWSA